MPHTVKVNEPIEKERRLREEAEERLKHIAASARELHWQLKPEYEARLRESEDKVRYLRLVSGGPEEEKPEVGEPEKCERKR